MTDEQHSIEAAPDLQLPWDLSQWAEVPQIRSWAEDVVGALDWNNPELSEWLRTHPDVQPKEMLSVLTLAYGLGIYDMEELENACYSNPDFQRLCGKGSKPGASQLNRFRRENRGLLKHCLFEVFKRAFKARFDLGDTFIPPGIRKHLLESSVARLDIARQMGRGNDSF
jgi:hypothetical protein